MRKSVLKTVDGTPKKRLFLSIISDYDIRTGLCELIDNAIDLWTTCGSEKPLEIRVTLDAQRQLISVNDNAGGVSEDNVELLISPGASRNDVGDALIGIFGVGGKRAGIALGELVEIKTRHGSDKSIQVDISNEWIESPDWDLDVYQVADLPPGTTTVDISKLRQPFYESDIIDIRKHLAETYSWFCEKGCTIFLNDEEILPKVFNSWAYPQDFLPHYASFKIEPVHKGFLDVKITGGLITDRDAEMENYGVYVYCNNRLIVKELKHREVGYYVSSEAGVPHPDASLCRVIVEYNGPANLMPWNSSKSNVNFSHPAFAQIRNRVIDFTSYFTKASRRTKHDWQGLILSHTSGSMKTIQPSSALSTRKTVLPRPPMSKRQSPYALIKTNNEVILKDKPWTIGLIESIGLVDIISKQNFQSKNRASLILLDSNFEIALKEFIVTRTDLFPPYKWGGVELARLFQRRSDVIKAVNEHVKFSQSLLDKINYYYNIRNTFIHQRASATVTDEQIADYRSAIETVLKGLFGLKFPDA
ncbi:histidine kinase [Sphingomonas lacunae]|uniref:Histidine kinase n=1 Tax=Sphingomonas lacunae TaxID=2698828 RepID=A0A6M4AX44_9SPHN|nr:ATP-binding protein [Sphingomonas lacunae]QJQ32922.1 histidine kinase [Sphingomonas lacunae]